jgi:hypothetical protein
MLMALLSGCEKNPTEIDEYVHEPFLYAFIFNGKMVDHIFLDRVAPVEGYYHPDDWFIYGADIIVFPVDNPEAGDTATFREHHRIDLGWFYLPNPNNYLYPWATLRYRIEVRKPSENIYLWSETTVPDTFTLTVNNYEVIDDTIWIPLDWNDAPLNLSWTGADSAGGYVLSVLCTQTGPLVSLDPDHDYDEEPDIQYLDTFRSSVRNIEVPWMAFNWVGFHTVTIQAASIDYIEYLESLFNAMESNPVSNIHGGRGVFSGFSSDSFVLIMQAVKQPDG